MSSTIAVVSLKGGVGRTTVVASLASALGQAGRRCLAVELDPQNGLATHFGRGLASRGIADVQVAVLAADRREGTRGDPVLVPFGSGEEQSLAEEKLAADVHWLGRRLQALTPAGCELVLLDTAAHRSPWLIRALQLADLVLVIVTPEPACYATLPAMEELLQQTRGDRSGGLAAHYVINRFDGSSAVGRDVVAALRGAFPGRVAPVMIHEDEAVREAMGRQRTVFRESAHSQVVADLTELGEWVAAMVGGKPESRPLRAAGARI